MPIGTGIVYNVGDLILSQVSSSGTAFLETKIAAATSSLIYFDSTARINSASLNSITVGTASYVSGSRSIITNLTASNISASGTSSFGYVGIGTTSPGARLDVRPTTATAYQGTVPYQTTTAAILSPVMAAASVDTYTSILQLVSVRQALVAGRYAHGYLGFSTVDNSNISGLLDAGRISIKNDDGIDLYSSTSMGFWTNTGGSASNPATERVRIASDGNVGIGTTSPLERITFGSSDSIIARSSDTTFNSGYCSRILFNQGGTGYGYLGFYTYEGGSGGGERMRIAEGGNVGIGTTVPVNKLQVAGNISGSSFTSSISNAVGFLGTSSFAINASTASYVSPSGNAFIQGGNSFGTTATLGTNDASALIFETNGTGRVTIDTNGNVGIGTSNPSTILTLSKPIDAAAYGSGSRALDFKVYFPGYDVDSVKASIYVGVSNQGTLQTTKGYLAFLTSATSGSQNLTEKMRIESDGNIGIGTTSPSAKLTIVDNTNGGTINLVGRTSDDTAAINFRATGDGSTYAYVAPDTNEFRLYHNDGFMSFYPGGSEKVRITSAGNVGIGSTVPGAKLDVVGDLRVKSGGAAIILDTNAATDGRMEYKYNGTRKALIGVDSDNLQISADSGNYLQFITNGSQRMIITNGGGVGIGTSNPNYAFDVYTNGSADALMSIRASGSANARIYFDAANGDLTGGDYCHLGQDKTTLNFVINTGGSAGNIHLQPKEGTNNGILFVSGSTRFGRVISQTHEFTGSVNISGSLNATASWANNAVSASYATTAQTANALNTGNSYTIAGLTNNGTLSQQGTLSMGSGYQILATTGTAPIPGIAFVGDTNTGIYSPSADTIGFSISGSEKIRIDSNGNVGIGTTSSGGILEVYGATSIFRYDTAGAASLYLRNWTSGGTTQMIFGVASGDDQSTTLSFASNIFSIGNYGDPGSEIRFGTRNSSTADIRVTINQDGNVGIGTTSPVAKLEISGSSNSALLNIKSPSSSTILYVSGSGAVGVGTSAYTGIGGNGYLMLKNVLCFVSDNTANSNNRNWSIGTNGQFNGDLYFVTSADSSSFPNDAYRISFTRTGDIITNGSIGIGTSNPINKLQVNGNVSGSSFTSSISNAVGFLGTSSWAQNVVSASFATTAQTANALNASNTYTVAGLTSAYVDVNGSATIPSTGIYRPSSKTLGLSADATLILKINGSVSPYVTSIETGNFLVQSGNVGIGTTNATDKLTLYGELASYKTGADTIQTQVYLANAGNTRAFNLQLNSGGTGLDLWSYNSANAWLRHTTFNYDGNVGIGTAAPAAKLEISGSSNSALLHVKSPISGAILYVSGSGAVGINTSTVGAYTLQVNGSFAATTKSFVIDHPTKAGKRLIYGSLESPYHGIRLTGRDTLKDGKCKIQLPDYIYKLILHDSVNIQLTGIKCNKTLYVDDINIPENYFTIAYDKALFESYKDYDFFWDFTAIRADVPELNTEL